MMSLSVSSAMNSLSSTGMNSNGHGHNARPGTANSSSSTTSASDFETSPSRSGAHNVNSRPSTGGSVTNSSPSGQAPSALTPNSPSMNSQSSAQQTKRKRSRVTPSQLSLLESFYTTSRSLDASRRKEISELLGMEERQTQIWFQNRRAKAKLIEQREMREREREKIVGGPSLSDNQGSDYFGGLPAGVPTVEELQFMLQEEEPYTSPSRRTLTYFVRSAGVGFKMKISFDSIVRCEYGREFVSLQDSADLTGDSGPTDGISGVERERERITLTLNKPPTFYREVTHLASSPNGSATGSANGVLSKTGTTTRWRPAHDWTEGMQASTCVTHHLMAPLFTLTTGEFLKASRTVPGFTTNGQSPSPSLSYSSSTDAGSGSPPLPLTGGHTLDRSARPSSAGSHTNSFSFGYGHGRSRSRSQPDVPLSTSPFPIPYTAHSTSGHGMNNMNMSDFSSYPFSSPESGLVEGQLQGQLTDFSLLPSIPSNRPAPSRSHSSLIPKLDELSLPPDFSSTSPPARHLENMNRHAFGATQQPLSLPDSIFASDRGSDFGTRRAHGGFGGQGVDALAALSGNVNGFETNGEGGQGAFGSFGATNGHSGGNSGVDILGRGAHLGPLTPLPPSNPSHTVTRDGSARSPTANDARFFDLRAPTPGSMSGIGSSIDIASYVMCPYPSPSLSQDPSQNQNQLTNETQPHDSLTPQNGISSSDKSQNMNKAAVPGSETDSNSVTTPSISDPIPIRPPFVGFKSSSPLPFEMDSRQ